LAGKDTWGTEQWAAKLLQHLTIGNWGIPRVIISDRDKKFLSQLWTHIFRGLGVELLYSTAYHPQTDGQSGRTNQTVEIALRHMLTCLHNPKAWPQVLPQLRAALNSTKNSMAQSAYELMLP